MSKISELGSITGANTRTEDLFVIVNLVQGDDGTKNITRKELVQAIQYEIFDRITITGGSITGTTIFNNTINDNVMNDNEFNRGSVNDTDINRADIDDSLFHDGVIEDSTANNLSITFSSFDDGTMETVTGNNVTLINSTIDQSEITQTNFSNGSIEDSTANNITITDSFANNLIMSNSEFNDGTANNVFGRNFELDTSIFTDGEIQDSTAVNVAITDSTFANGEIENSTANNITITSSTFDNGELSNSTANNMEISASEFDEGFIYNTYFANGTIEYSSFSEGTGNNNIFSNTVIEEGIFRDGVIANSTFTGSLSEITLQDAVIESSTMSNTGISESTMMGGRIEQAAVNDATINRPDLVDFDMDLEKKFDPSIDENSWFALKNVKTGETERITYRQFFDEISKSTSKALKVHVEASSGDDRNPGTVLQPVRTLERAAELALEKAGGVYSRNDVNNAVHISCGPGTYYTKGGIALPDDCSLTSTSGQYATVIEALPGYEFNNAILVGSGCYVQGFSYTNWKVDNFDFPEGGFAIAYRPGAKLRRSPYIRDSSQLSNFLRADVEPPLQPFNSKGTLADLGREIFMESGHAGDFIEGDEVNFGSGARGVISWDQDVTSDDRIYVRNLKGEINVGDTIITESGGTGNILTIGIDDFPNPLVGRGGGCVLVDRRVLDPDSLYTYILTFGFTPRTQNGIGYVARDGAGVNGIGSLSIFTRCAFYALNGGQVTLNNSGTQFGDISMRAKGTTTFYAPRDTTVQIDVNAGGNTVFGDTILSNANNIIDDMVDYLTSNTSSGGLGYQGYDAQKCYRDSGIIIDKLGQDIQTGSNYWGRLSGITYRSPISYVVPGEQLTETLGANRYLQDRIEDLFSNANTEILERANTSYDELLNILENGEEYASPIVFTEVANSDVSDAYTSARKLLQDNRKFIQDELIDWIEDNDEFFAYNSISCRRDTQDYILPAVAHDMLLDTNYNAITAGNAYYMNAAAKVINNQRDETIAAYKRLKDQTAEILDANSSVGATRADNAFDTIIDFLEEKKKTYTPTFAEYDPISGIMEVEIGQHRLEEGDKIVFEADSITFECGVNGKDGELTHPRTTDGPFQKALPILEVTDTTFVVQVGNAGGYTNIHYFKSADSDSIRLAENCHTPVGSTYDPVSGITVVTFDEPHNIEAGDLIEISPGGITYSCANTATLQTIEISHPRPSDKWYKNALQVDAVTAYTIKFNSGDAGGYTGAHTYIRSLENAVQIVGKGLRFSDDITISAEKRNARKQLQANKTYIQDYMLGWIDNNFFIYDSEKCARDVQEYILPAVQQDMVLGTNFSSVQTGVGYYTATASEVVGDQLPETVGAVNELKSLVSDQTQATYTPTNSTYDPLTGITNLTIGTHNIQVGDSIKLLPESITYECTYNSAVGTDSHPNTSDPNYNKPFVITAVDATSITFNSGDANGYTGVHTFVSAMDNAVLHLAHDSAVLMNVANAFDEITHIMGGSGRAYTPTDATYNPVTGVMEVTIGVHNLTTDDQVMFAPESISFYCDANNVVISHPRRSDTDNYKKPLDITAVTATTITVNAGDAGGYTGAHTFYRADDNAVSLFNAERKTTYTPTTATYDPATGLMVVTVGVHNFKIGQFIEIDQESITFTCAKDGNATEHSYPRYHDPYNKTPVKITAVTETTFTVNVGGYASGTAHTFVRAQEGCIRDDVVIWSDPASYAEFKTPTGASYNVGTGVFSITIPNHGLSAGDRVELMPGSFTFTCASDGNVSEISHPRPSDPPYKTPLAITATPDINTIQVQAGIGSGGTHTFVRASEGAVAVLTGNVDEVNAYNSLQKNRDFLANEVVGYLANTYFIYDSSKCERDSGYVLDAVKRDVLTGSNYNSVYMGKGYLIGTTGADTVINDQLTETVGAFTWLKGQVNTRLSGTAQTRANAAFDEIIDIVSNGSSAIDPINFGDSYVSNDSLNTRGILQSNKAFLQAEITAWLALNYPSFTYDVAKCERDVGVLVDAASYDIQHGSNVSAINVARLYFENAVSVLPVEQRHITAEAFMHIASVAKKLARNETVTPTTGNAVASTAWTNVSYTPTDVEYNPVTGIMMIDLGATHSFSNGDYIIFDPESITLSCGTPVQNIVHPRPTDPVYEKPVRILASTANTITLDVGDAGGYQEPHAFVSASAGAVKKYFSDFMGQRVEDLINIVSDCIEEDTLDRLPAPVEPNDIGTAFYQTAAKGTIVGGGSTAREGVVKGGSGGIDGAQSGLLSYNVGGPEMEYPQDKFSPFEFGPGETGYADEFQAATKLINGLTEKLQTEVTEYINETYNGIGFKQSKCIRDTGYLVDAISEDLLYGGNQATIKAAEAYFINSINLLPDYQYDATRAAFIHLAERAEKVVLETVIEPHFEGAYTPTDVDYDPVEGSMVLTLGSHDILEGDYIWFETEGITFECVNAASLSTVQISHPRAVAGDGYPDPAYLTPWPVKSVDATTVTLTGFNAGGYAGAHTFISATTDAIKHVQFQTVAQDFSGTATSVTTAQRVQDLITVIADIVDDRTNENIPAVTDKPDQLPLRTFARKTLQANRKFLVQEVVSYLNQNYFTFDRDKCQRDAGFFIDAVRRDFATDSVYNVIFNARGYLSGTSGSDRVIDEQLTQTVGGLRNMEKMMIKEIETRIKDRSEDTGEGPSVGDNEQIIKKLFDTLINKLTTRNDTELDGLGSSGARGIFGKSSRYVSNAGDSVGYQNGSSILMANRDFLAAEVVAYVNANTPPSGYDQAKCLRDAGFLVDAATYDYMHGGNTAVRNFAKLYYENGIIVLPANQITATANVYTHIADVMEDVIQNISVTKTSGNAENQSTSAAAAASAAQALELKTLVEIVATVISANDVSVLPTEIEPTVAHQVAIALDPSPYEARGGSTGNSYTWLYNDNPSDLINVDALKFDWYSQFVSEWIDAKRSTLASSFIPYIVENHQGLPYSEAKCRRDTGYIIDGISHDIQYGGNSATHRNAEIYFENAINTLPSSQREPTKKAFMHLGDVMEKLLMRLDVTPTVSSKLGSQFTPTTATYDPFTGIMEATLQYDHGLKVGEAIMFADYGMTFSCDMGSGVQNHTSPAPHHPYWRKPCPIIGVTDTTVILNVGTGGTGLYPHTFVSAVDNAFTKVLGNFIQQDKRYLPAVYPERGDIANVAKNLANFIANVVDDEDPSGIPAYEAPDTSWVPSNYIAAKTLIQRDSVQFAHDVVDYVSREWDGLSFPRGKCRRDIGFLVDAASHDVQYETNYASRIAAQIYFENGISVLPKDTRRQTADVYRTMKLLMSNIVQEIDTANSKITSSVQDISGVPATLAEGNEVISLVGIIEDVIREDSVAAIPPLQEANTAWVSTDLTSAFGLIEDNKVQLADDLIDFINTEFNVLDYNKSKCIRDTGYLIDAFSYDLNYGGNTASRWNADFYFWNTVYRIPEDQRVPTAKSYRQLGKICADIVLGKYEGQVIKTETATEVEAEKVQGLADMFYLTQINKDTKELQKLDEPDYGWVAKPFRDAADILLARRGPLQYDVVRFVNAEYKFVDIRLTRRDAGNLLQTIANDVKFTNPNTGARGSTKATRTFSQSLFDQKGQHVFPVFNPTTPGLIFKGTVADISARNALQSDPNVSLKKNHAYIVSNDANINFYDGTIYYWNGVAWVNDGANNTDLLYAFYKTWDRMRDFIIANYSPDGAHSAFITALFDDCLKDNVLRPDVLTFGSLVESIAHQFNGGAAGVNRTALPLNFRNLGPATSAISSVLSEDGGRVRWSGADELNNQYFARGLRINGRTGRIEGRPFTSSVRKLARRASNSRAVV